MLIKEIMTKSVITVNPNDTFLKVIKILVKNKISGVVVLGRGKKVLSVVSEKDLFYMLFPDQKKFYKDIEFYINYKNIEGDVKRLVNKKVKSFMRKRVYTINPDDHVLKACAMFLVHNIRRLPVVENGRLVGIVTTNDIYRNYLNRLISKTR